MTTSTIKSIKSVSKESTSPEKLKYFLWVPQVVPFILNLLFHQEVKCLISKSKEEDTPEVWEEIETIKKWFLKMFNLKQSPVLQKKKREKVFLHFQWPLAMRDIIMAVYKRNIDLWNKLFTDIIQKVTKGQFDGVLNVKVIKQSLFLSKVK